MQNRFNTTLLIILFIMTNGAGYMLHTVSQAATEEKSVPEIKIQDTRAEQIDSYFKKRNMPLAGYGAKMVEVADKNGIDWRLLPAISVKESSGGKHICGHNPFGWGSCKIVFKNFDEAIETVGAHLGGNVKSTSRYYKGVSSERKLYYYNGTVEKEYPQRVLKIMTCFDVGNICK